MKRLFVFLYLSFLSVSLYAQPIVNVYIWGGIVPTSVILQFEHDTGIKVNVSTYDSNETMYAKLKSSQRSIYDVIIPSSYFVERMHKQGMLSELDPAKLSHLANLDPLFTENAYDNGNHFSIPLIWGTTGLFYNAQWVKTPLTRWIDLWDKRWLGQLMLLDDSREVFNAALMRLGYSPNDTNPAHIAEAYQALRALTPNIKLFASDSIQATMIDEDSIAGLAWNGDAFKAQNENHNIHFVYPQDGFVIWVDCLAIPINPPHPDEAHQFINYLLQANIAAQIALKEGHAITNARGKALLPPEIRNNPMVYPGIDTFRRGVFQRDVGEETIALYNEYWQKLKLMF
jgi:spermidine/putrescine transport system substrate-binding protein